MQDEEEAKDGETFATATKKCWNWCQQQQQKREKRGRLDKDEARIDSVVVVVVVAKIRTADKCQLLR